jgi:hypothetical protein
MPPFFIELSGKQQARLLENSGRTDSKKKRARVILTSSHLSEEKADW